MVTEMEWQDRLTRVVQWGDDPVIECDVERVERLHEAALAATPEDESAYGCSEVGS